MLLQQSTKKMGYTRIRKEWQSEVNKITATSIKPEIISLAREYGEPQRVKLGERTYVVLKSGEFRRVRG
jgi:hypothetical protein